MTGLSGSALGQGHERPEAVGADRGIGVVGADDGLLPRRREHLPQVADDHQEPAARLQRALDPRVRARCRGCP